MAASAADVVRLRRMAAEPNDTNGYTSAVLTEIIERYPIIDAFGEWPVDDDGETNADWTATYDLNSAAAEVWTEKAAAVAANYDFSADGGDFKRSQATANAQRMASYYRSRRSAMPVRIRADINTPTAQDWIGNLSEILDD